jgi:hypothetical protein
VDWSREWTDNDSIAWRESSGRALIAERWCVDSLAGHWRRWEASAKGEKALICHYTSSTTNPYNIIEVSANAVAAHEAHGDHLAFDCGNGPQCTACFPDACTAGTVGVISGDPWTVCRADADSAWLSAATLGEYDALAACQSLGYSSFGQYGGNCGSICGYCESGTSCDNPGTEVYDGQGLGNCGAGVLCFTVTWECLA